MNAYQYPLSPAMVAAEKLNPSAAFKKQVTKVITAIVLFFLVYLLLVAAAVALAITCCYLGVQLIVFAPKFITLVAGLGLIAIGLSVIFFLIKFIFAVSKNENPLRIEITEQDQPEIFSFIRQLSHETKTPFPKKIFISPEVNACVFYNSSFWSMFLPVRKNLEIGLGLVNSINISELKAVIAHEFGHFSQRSMKLGSFTYNVNRIIYNMLYENNSYNSFLNAWGRLHGILSICAMATVKIAEGIQYILRAMYGVINKNYMGLSREMEFHADAVAASIAGGNNVISGLSRIELAASCYSTALNKADALLKENKKLNNVYTNQLTIYRSLAVQYKLALKNELPEVSFDFVRAFSTSRINYKDQWASHPELHERKAHLDVLDINIAPDESPAWVVFNEPQHLQEQLTEKLYSQVTTEASLQQVDSSVFDDLYKKEAEDYALPADYKGYYDFRFIDTKEWDMDALSNNTTTAAFNDLFTEEYAQLQSAINNNTADIETLKAIWEKQIDVKSFDFDGVKYSREDCDAIMQQLNKDSEKKQQQLKQLDKKAFLFFNQYDAGIADKYRRFELISRHYDMHVEIVNRLLNTMHGLYNDQLTLEQAESITGNIKTMHEKELKKQLEYLLQEGIVSHEKNEKLFSDVQLFLQKDNCYFANNKFMHDELNALSDNAIQSANAFYDHKFKAYKNLLEYQLKGYQSAVKAETYIA